MINTIKISPEFKAQVVKTVAAIILFIIVYLVILAGTLLLTFFCVVGGLGIIFAAPGILTIIIGLGLAGMGAIILIYVLKFIFKSHKIDRSHLVEIKEKDEPALFRMIGEIVEEVGTNFPRKVYLSSRVNAAVFYDSSFWSMFLPIRKNLEIGLGLVNTLTAQELKAVLAHEFGHFSQKTMKVGSYVYNVNSIIHNMLYDNEGMERGIQSWASWSWIVALFAQGAIWIIQLVQKVLQLVYGIVNKSYLALSREMEFHADEIAVNVTGIGPMKSALSRIEFGDGGFDTVLKFYGERIAENITVDNLYQHHRLAMQYMAKKNALPLDDRGLPVLDAEAMTQFSKSKLVIEDQWASHPTTEQRLKRMEATGVAEKPGDDRLAIDLFRNPKAIQEQLTELVFANVTYGASVVVLTESEFEQQFRYYIEAYDFDPLYNGYYDARDIAFFDLEERSFNGVANSKEELFSDSRVKLIKQTLALKQDLETLCAIHQGLAEVKTFDYDGKKYRKRGIESLITQLETEYIGMQNDIQKNDLEAYRYFLQLARQQNEDAHLKTLYKDYFDYTGNMESKMAFYHEMTSDLHFLQEITPHEVIETNFLQLVAKEEELKEKIRELLADGQLEALVYPGIKANLDKYLAKTWKYFGHENYYEDNLQVLYDGLNGYANLIANVGFLTKRRLLDYQTRLAGLQT